MKKIFLFILIVFFNFNIFAQNTKFSAGNIINEFSGFNFFLGSDADKFKTTPKAFGSGIFDFSGQYTIKSFWLLEPVKRNIGLATTVALKINKFRFKDNLYFDTNADSILIDNNASHYYNNMYFCRHGSKLVTGKLNIPLIFYFPISQWFGDNKGVFGIFAGAYYDAQLFAYHKLYYEENDRLVKNKTKNNKIKQYFTKNNFGLRGGIKIFNIFLFGQHSLTPIFSNLPYDIYETKIGFNFKINYDQEKIEEKIDDLGTDAK